MRRARPLLGTYVEIEAKGADEQQLERAINAAFAAVERAHRLMSFHDPDSDVSRLNRRAAREPVVVDTWTSIVLRRARLIFGATAGLFDCAVGRELMDRGMLPRHGRDHVEKGTFAAVRFLSDGQVAFDSPIALDLGGIAKGFAVDRAIAVLRACGVREMVVNAGGDIRVVGNTPQRIYIRSNGTPASIVPGGYLQNGAIATSTTDTTIPRIQISSDVLSSDNKAYSVIAPTCLVADALTKVLVQIGDPNYDIFARFGAKALVTSFDHAGRVAA